MRAVGSGVVAGLAAACLLSGAVLFVDAVWVEPDWIEVTHHLEYVPAWRRSAPDLVLVHLSDPHVERMGRRERRALDLIAAARPDLIAITGDLVRDGSDPEALERFLAALPAKRRVFAVWGTRDHASGLAGPAGEALLARAGIVLLDNAHRRIETAAGPLVVAGVDDPSSGRDNLGRALAGVAREDVTLLLSHGPEIAGALGNRDVDLMLSGDLQGGPIRLPLPALLLPSGTRAFEDGWFDADGGARLHVSRGLGSPGLPLRFLCRPRLDVITLRGGLKPSPPHRRRSNAA
jgi:predicted MPP superfamily phosphohydrolase